MSYKVSKSKTIIIYKMTILISEDDRGEWTNAEKFLYFAFRRQHNILFWTFSLVAVVQISEILAGRL